MTKKTRKNPKRVLLELDLAAPTVKLMLLIAEHVAKRIRAGALPPGGPKNETKTRGDGICRDAPDKLDRHSGRAPTT
jgi:hypothetical protein